MSIIIAVTNLEVRNHPDAVVEAPSKITVIATTQEIDVQGGIDDFKILWEVNQVPIPNVTGSELETRIEAGAHLITAKGAGGGSSLTVKAWELDLKIVGGSQFLITDEPEMPDITAQAKVIGPVSFIPDEWKCSVRFAGADDCVNVPTFGEIHEDILLTQTSGDQFTPTFDKVRGRDISFSLTFTIEGQSQQGFVFANLLGTNPDRDDVNGALPHDTLRRIACRESGLRQFDAPADGGTSRCPLYDSDKRGKVGIMQIADPTPDEVWNWRLNVERGIEIFNEKVEAARQYPDEVRNSSNFQALVDQFNLRRQQQGLSPIKISLPDFTTGNFDDDLQQVELDAVRGYNGWFGTDRFGFELHEFRVAVDVVAGAEVLRVTNINEQSLEGIAVWERVPVEDRPSAGEGNVPDYAKSVLDLFPGCSGLSSTTCTIEIDSSPFTRSFSPPSITGIETFIARIQGEIPPSTTIEWKRLKAPNDPPGAGNILIEKQTNTANMGRIVESAIVVRARHPNKALIRARVVHSGVTVCQDIQDMSVPQFFQIVFLSNFEQDLADLGLFRPGPDPDSVSVNETIKQAVIAEILDTLVSLSKPVNFRFMLDNPGPVVGSGNFSTVIVGGRDNRERFGTEPLTLDFDNILPNNRQNPARVFSGQFADRDNLVTADRLYLAIFDGLAVRDPDGNPDGGVKNLPGTPVGVSDLADPPINVRQRTVRAAIVAFAKMVAYTIAHECGHAVGVDHLSGNNDLVMDAGDKWSFTEMTGITSFNPATGVMIPRFPLPAGFGEERFGPPQPRLPVLSSNKHALTLALLVELSDLVILGKVTIIKPITVNSVEARILHLAIQTTLKGKTTYSEADVLAPSLLDEIAIGNVGLFFLNEMVQQQRYSTKGSQKWKNLAPWILEERAGFLPGDVPDFELIIQYVNELLNGKTNFIALAVDKLFSANSRLHAEAAFDLSRYDLNGFSIPEMALETILSALRDSTFPDEARAALVQILDRRLGDKNKLISVLIDLLEAKVGGSGFQIAAAGVLTRFPASEAVAVLVELIDTDHHLVRAQAITGLGAIASEEAIQRLVTVSEDHPDSFTREVAKQVLDLNE